MLEYWAKATNSHYSINPSTLCTRSPWVTDTCHIHFTPSDGRLHPPKRGKNGGENGEMEWWSGGDKELEPGSSSTELSVQSIQYLVGRIFVFNLYPFSFKEYLRFKEAHLFIKIRGWSL